MIKKQKHLNHPDAKLNLQASNKKDNDVPDVNILKRDGQLDYDVVRYAIRKSRANMNQDLDIKNETDDEAATPSTVASPDIKQSPSPSTVSTVSTPDDNALPMTRNGNVYGNMIACYEMKI